MGGLRDRQAKLRIQARIDRLASGNPGKHRVLSGGVAELKIDLGPGYRVYYTRYGDIVIVLLAGGDKHTQQAEISTRLLSWQKRFEETFMTKTKIRTTPWDSAEYLKTDQDIVEYMAACMEEGGDDPAFIAHALGVVAKARNMSQLARNTGLTREGLYKALSGEGNPSFATVMKVAQELGFKLTLLPAQEAWRQRPNA